MIGAIAIDWISLITAGATTCLACVTALMALATVGLALETRATRKEALVRSLELSFRVALTDLALLITAHEGWRPLLQPRPPEGWLQSRTSLRSILVSLASVTLLPALWRRVLSVAVNVEAADNWLKGELVEANPEHAKGIYYIIDIYLKQLARYLAAEMKRQRLAGAEIDAVVSAYPFIPLPWAYGDISQSPEASAQLMESQALPPFSAISPEPEIPGFEDGRLSSLIAEARGNIRSILKPEGDSAI